MAGLSHGAEASSHNLRSRGLAVAGEHRQAQQARLAAALRGGWGAWPARPRAGFQSPAQLALEAGSVLSHALRVRHRLQQLLRQRGRQAPCTDVGR